MYTLKFVAAIIIILLFTSCVSQKKYATSHDRAALCETNLNKSQNENMILETSLANAKNQAKSLAHPLEYFKSTNIKSRKNMKLHLQHVPKRYWKYLTEKSSWQN